MYNTREDYTCSLPWPHDAEDEQFQNLVANQVVLALRGREVCAEWLVR